MKDRQCSEKNRSGNFSYSMGYPQCKNQGSIERYGKWYCGKHDPIAIEQRQNSRDARCMEKEARLAAGEMGIELAKRVMAIPLSGSMDLEIDVIKMPSCEQWATICWAAKALLEKL